MNTPDTNTEPIEVQAKELETNLSHMRGELAQVKGLSTALKSLQEDNLDLIEGLADLRRDILSINHPPSTINYRSRGRVSDDCARRIAATFINHCARSGTLEALASQSAQRDALVNFARHSLGVTTQSALTTSDIPLPTEYSGELS